MPTMSEENAKNFAGNTAQIVAFQTALRNWFLRERRDMPWRRERSVYRTVVSEFMLQQTQVETVRPYFENWVAKWKDFPALANADEAEVLRAWEGLGYYSRARNLLAVAKKIVADGRVPDSVEAWLEFRGIGAYTAAAIAGIAQGVPAAVTDGNVVRVLARLSGDETHFKNTGDAVKYFSPLAHKVLNTEQPGDHNEALMELGATLCTKHNPRCPDCPVAKFCCGRRLENVATLPHFAPRATKKVEVNRTFVKWDDGSILFVRTLSKTRRLRELLEFPRWEDVFPGEKPPAGKLLLEGRRGIASENILERIYAGTLPKNELPDSPGREIVFVRVPSEELDGVTLSGPHRKWLRKILLR